MEDESNNSETPFPWAVGVFDAHCHPTDTMSSIPDIPHMKTTALTVMSTRGEDQDLVDGMAKTLGLYHPESTHGRGKIVPCFGWHPWFAHLIRITGHEGKDDTGTVDMDDDDEAKCHHYRSVLTGSLGSAEEDESFYRTLPTPKPLADLLDETRARLLAHPNALVGEVGLDKAIRLPMPWQEVERETRNTGLTPGSREGRKLSPYRVSIEHQKALLKAQLQLAGELNRAVSVHGVQAHGAVLDVFQQLWSGHERNLESKRRKKTRVYEEKNEVEAEKKLHDSDDSKGNRYHDDHGHSGNVERNNTHSSTSLPYPPRICMHSYSGSPEAIQQLVNPKIPSDVYFSFSTVINFAGPSVKWVKKCIETLPEDRILIESDLHTAGERMDNLLEESVRTVCDVKNWSLEDGTKRLADNWKRFVFG